MRARVEKVDILSWKKSWGPYFFTPCTGKLEVTKYWIFDQVWGWFVPFTQRYLPKTAHILGLLIKPGEQNNFKSTENFAW